MQEYVENSHTLDKKIDDLETPGEESLIHFFVRKMNIPQLNSLLELAPESINETNEFQETALHLAVKNESATLTKLLLDNKADPNVIDSFGFAPIHIAAGYKSTECFELLLKAEANIDIKAKNQATALMFACSKNNCQTANLLLEKGANINACNVHKQSALYLATKNKHASIVSLLLAWGAEIPVFDKNLQLDSEMKTLFLKYSVIRNEKTSVTKLLTLFNDGKFPSLKQITGFFIHHSHLKTKCNTLTNDLKEYVTNYQPKNVKLRPWSDLYKFLNSRAKDNEQRQLSKIITSVQKLSHSSDYAATEVVIANALTNLEEVFSKQSDAEGRLLMAQKIYSDTLSSLQPHSINPFIKS